MGIRKSIIMIEENISQVKLKNIDKKINHLIEEIHQHDLMSKGQKKVCGVMNYTEHFLILVSTVTG